MRLLHLAVNIIGRVFVISGIGGFQGGSAGVVERAYARFQQREALAII